jgi:hypothetical protein
MLRVHQPLDQRHVDLRLHASPFVSTEAIERARTKRHPVRNSGKTEPVRRPRPANTGRANSGSSVCLSCVQICRAG